MSKRGIDKAIAYFGSQSALANALGVTRASVSHWFVGKHKIPAKWCVEIEKKTGVSRKELRPDLFD